MQSKTETNLYISYFLGTYFSSWHLPEDQHSRRCRSRLYMKNPGTGSIAAHFGQRSEERLESFGSCQTTAASREPETRWRLELLQPYWKHCCQRGTRWRLELLLLEALLPSRNQVVTGAAPAPIEALLPAGNQSPGGDWSYSSSTGSTAASEEPGGDWSCSSPTGPVEGRTQRSPP